MNCTINTEPDVVWILSVLAVLLYWVLLSISLPVVFFNGLHPINFTGISGDYSIRYFSGMLSNIIVYSKSFVGKDFLRNKLKYELTVHFKPERRENISQKLRIKYN